ncbi:DNA-directed RNA polymerase II subunit [Oleoguttula sp. CCFEE 5521]
MFFIHDMEERMTLEPAYFSGESEAKILDELYQRVEGRNTGTMMIVRIMSITDVSDGEVMQGTGVALYTVSFQALVWQPFRGEVVDGSVTSVLMSGFFVDVGALQVFMIPTSFQYTVEGSTPSFSDVTADGFTIEVNTQVRLRIKGLRSEMGAMYAVGSIKEDYLGPLLQ